MTWYALCLRWAYQEEPDYVPQKYRNQWRAEDDYTDDVDFSGVEVVHPDPEVQRAWKKREVLRLKSHCGMVRNLLLFVSR